MSKDLKQQPRDTEQPSPCQDLQAELEPLVEEIISKALEKDRQVSYQFVSHLRTDLTRSDRDAESARSTTFGELTHTTEVKPWWRRKATLAIVVLAALIALGIRAIPYFIH